jgi:thiol-disulfide isomerase/thioredoxin
MMLNLTKPLGAVGRFTIFAALLCCCVGSLAADEYTGQFAMELEAERGNLDQVIFQPPAGRLNFKLPTLDSGANVTFSFLYNPNNEKLEVPALLVEEAGEGPYLWVDANLDRSFDGAEKFPLRRESEDNPYVWDGVVNIPLQKGAFKTFPLFVKFFRGVKWDDMNDDDRLLLQSNEVYAKGFVEIQGKKTLVAYSYNPRERKISVTRGKVAIDCDGDGEIDWGRFSGEASEAEGEAAVFRVGNAYVSNKRVDVEKNVIVLKAHPAGDYKRLELKVGDTFPDFEFKDFQGRKRRLAEFRGKHVLLDFWAIWCGPCRREMQYQKAAYQRYNARGFEILGLNADEADYVSQVKSWLEKNKLDWTQATRESIMPLMRALRIHYYPTTLLLDPEGKVVSLDERKKGQLELRGKELLESLQSIFFPKNAGGKADPRAESGGDSSAASAERPALRKNSSGGGETEFGNIRLSALPDGFKWKAAEKLKLFCVVPDEWKYREEVRGEDVVITISEDGAAAAVEVEITARKKVSGSAAELAAAMMEKFAKGKQVAGKQQNQFGDQAQSLLVLQDGNRVIFYTFVVNTKTNSLRVGTFACPLSRMNEIGQTAQTVMNQVIWIE